MNNFLVLQCLFLFFQSPIKFVNLENWLKTPKIDCKPRKLIVNPEIDCKPRKMIVNSWQLIENPGKLIGNDYKPREMIETPKLIEIIYLKKIF